MTQHEAPATWAAFVEANGIVPTAGAAAKASEAGFSPADVWLIAPDVSEGRPAALWLSDPWAESAVYATADGVFERRAFA